MSFRRIPFQFSATDPAERQRELEKRFGLPRNKMYIDKANPLSMGTGLKDSSASSSSPRLQHRVPIFVRGYDQPMRSSVDSMNFTSDNKKSNVRVIPIEIEGVEKPSARHRTFSGPAGLVKEHSDAVITEREESAPLKRSMQDLTNPTKMKAASGPKVYNIPVEGVSNLRKSSKSENVKSPVNKNQPKVNGYKSSKQVKLPDISKTEPENSEQVSEMIIDNSLKKIENVLEELKSYDLVVQEFSGTIKDKQYRYLDEMLTRCMLRLDDIDTMGNDIVRSVRKNAVKKVQACIDFLERKVNTVNDVATSSVTENEVKNVQIQDSKCDMMKVKDGAAEDTKSDNKNEVAEEISMNDVDMIEDKNVENKQEINEMEPTLSENDSVRNINVIEVTEKSVETKIIPEMSREVPEVEMVDFKEDSQFHNINSENKVIEVEMSDGYNNAHLESTPDNAVLSANNVAQSTKLQVLTDTVSHEGDVEMKEVKSTLDDVKKVLEEKSKKIDSSHCEEQVNSNYMKEASTDVEESETTPEVSLLQSECYDKDSSQNVDKDNKRHIDVPCDNSSK